MKRVILCSLVVGLAACGTTEEEPVQIITIGDDGTKSDETAENNVAVNNSTVVAPVGLALLGNTAHTISSVDLKVLAGPTASLHTPRDLAFHPSRPTELWVLNLDDNSTTVFDNPNTPEQGFTRYAAGGKDHFMARPAALAFSDNGNFASANEEDELTQGTATPEDFMGPTLWTSDRSIYDGGHGGHLDMLHNSPNGAGIAWESDNRFWVFDGYHQSITMYDFNMDHGPGGQYHGDGDVARYVEGEVGYIGDVPSHLEFNQEDQLIYIADSGNNRIARLDPSVGEMGGRTSPNYDGGAQYTWNGGQIDTWVEGADVMLEVPSGLEIHNGMVFVSDNKLSRVVALDMDGNLVDYLDLADEVPTGGLMGMAFAQDGSLYLVDAVGSRILRVAANDGSSVE